MEWQKSKQEGMGEDKMNCRDREVWDWSPSLTL